MPTPGDVCATDGAAYLNHYTDRVPSEHRRVHFYRIRSPPLQRRFHAITAIVAGGSPATNGTRF